MATDFRGSPGLAAGASLTPRNIFANVHLSQYVSSLVTIDGTASRDPGNSPTSLLRAGLLLGKVTASGKYAASVLGLTAAALGGNQTTLSTSAAVATEVNRRLGASGTLKLVGPNVAGGTVRAKTVTYSAVNVTTGAITITATVAAAVSAVNQINSLVTVDSTGSGTFTITVEGITTGAITYSATIATLISNINTALNATFGTSAIVSSGASLAALVLTFSGTGYSGRPVGAVATTPLAASTGYTISGDGTVGTSTTSPVTTAGVTAVAADEGEFVSGSIIGPVDGSYIPLTVLPAFAGVDVADVNGTSIDQPLPLLLRGADFIATQIVNLTEGDASVQAWLKTQLKNQGYFTFDNDR